MGSTRRAFTDEYRAEAVKFVMEGERPVAEVARNIGVHEMTLGKWVKRVRDAAAAATPADAPLDESERMELIRLRAECKDKDAQNADLLCCSGTAGTASAPPSSTNTSARGMATPPRSPWGPERTATLHQLLVMPAVMVTS